MEIAQTAERSEFYARAAEENLSPLWTVLDSLVTPEPVSPCQAAIWHYDDVRVYLTEASALISAEEAERRVMILENPGIADGHRITHSLYAGLQVVLPGEIAPPHRHAANALRLIVEGHGAYTSVDGEKTLLSPGDFVITPGWSWHDHGNDSDEPVVWLDGLDVHLVNLLDASFREGHPEPVYPVSRGDGASFAMHGHNMRPIDYDAGRAINSPIFKYPYATSREVLDTMARNGPADPFHGHKMKFVNPLNGDWAMSTIATCMQLLPAGMETLPYRSTDSTVFSVVEGHGRSEVGGRMFDWSPRDVFVVPSWVPVRHLPAEDAVLFSFSDRATQEKLGLWRERRGNH